MPDQFYKDIEYNKKLICAVLGIPHYLVEGYKETRFQKLKRQFLVWIFTTLDHVKRTTVFRKVQTSLQRKGNIDGGVEKAKRGREETGNL